MSPTVGIVLVSGASGYVALHCVQQLLQQGCRVRGTVRSLRNDTKVQPLRQLDGAAQRLELVEADLMNEDDWPRVVKGCSHVLHVASPWPIVADESTVKTAITGTLNLLKAAAAEPSVKKVVLTSSCAAVNDGHKNNERVFDETCWTKLDSKKVDNYARSKTIAEQKAWEFWNSLESENRFEFTVLNPTFITGPVLSTAEHGSATILGRMMDFKTFLASPRACLGVVDVRDVAKAHVLALTCEASNGERILITHERPTWFHEMRDWLAAEFKEHGFKISPINMPNWVIRLYSKTGIDEQSKAVVHRLGPELRFSNRKDRSHRARLQPGSDGSGQVESGHTMFYNPSVAPPQPEPLLWLGHRPFAQKPLFHSQMPPPPSLADQFMVMAPQPQFRRFSAGGLHPRKPLGHRVQPLASFQPNPQQRQQQQQQRHRNSNKTPTNRSESLFVAPNARKQFTVRNGCPRSVSHNFGQTPPMNAQNTYNFHPGMKDVPLWLKSLRLHKYTKLFEEMTYTQMMTLDESSLEQRQVTKGARKKILHSLDKLRDRPQLIRQLEKCIDENGDVRCLIVELRAILNTPMARFEPQGPHRPPNYVLDAIGLPAEDVCDENLPGLIARLTMRLHDHLFRNGHPQTPRFDLEEEYLVKLMQICDKILNSEAFTVRQKYCVSESKRVCAKFNQERRARLSAVSAFGHHPGNKPRDAPSKRPSDLRGPESNSDDSGVESTMSNVPYSLESPARSPDVRLLTRSGSQSVPSSPSPHALSALCADLDLKALSKNNPTAANKPNTWYNNCDSSCSSWSSCPSHAPTPVTVAGSPKHSVGQRWDTNPAHNVIPSQQQQNRAQKSSEQERVALLNLIDSSPELYNYLLSQLPKTQSGRAKPAEPQLDSTTSKHIPERAMAYMYPVQRDCVDLSLPVLNQQHNESPKIFKSTDLFSQALTAAMGQMHLHEKVTTVQSVASVQNSSSRSSTEDWLMASSELVQPPLHESHLPYLERPTDPLSAALLSLSAQHYNNKSVELNDLPSSTPSNSNKWSQSAAQFAGYNNNNSITPQTVYSLERSLRDSEPGQHAEHELNSLQRLLHGADSFFSASSAKATPLTAAESRPSYSPMDSFPGSDLASPLFQAFRPLACNAGGAVH